MDKLTFALDCELNPHEDWIAEGTEVQKLLNPVRNPEGFTAVIIEKALTHDGKEINFIPPYIEYFSNQSFKELRK